MSDGYDPDPVLVQIMVRAVYPNFDGLNPTQQAAEEYQCGLMLYALELAGYTITKEK